MSHCNFFCQESIVGGRYRNPYMPRPSPYISCFTRTNWTPSKVSKQSGVQLIMARRRHQDHLPLRVLHMVSVLLCEKLCYWCWWLKLSWKGKKNWNQIRQGKQSEGIEFNSWHQVHCIKILLICLQTWIVLDSVELPSTFYPILERFCMEWLLWSFKKEIT